MSAHGTRSDNLQRMHARGNTIIVAQYREVYGGRGDVVAQVYLGHRAKFATRWRSALIDNVSAIKIGDRADTKLVEVLVNALRPNAKLQVAA